jgi:putative hemolysin
MNKIWFILFVVGLLFLSGCAEKSPKQESKISNNSNQIANPASEFCVKSGGELKIKDSDKGQYGICMFSDGSYCEEWAYYRGKCKRGMNFD